MLTPPEAFVKAIQERPEDDAPRLMYADWLEERGDPRGEFIRVQCQLVHTAPGQPGWPHLAQRERELLAEHREAWVGPMLPRLSDADTPFHRGFLRPDLCRRLADEVLRTGSLNETLQRIERFASDPHCHEYLACLLQEIVMKFGAVTAPAAVRFGEKLSELGHPLGVLPLRLLGVEEPDLKIALLPEDVPVRENRRPSRRTRPPEGVPYPAPSRGHASVPFRDITTPADTHWIASAVSNWDVVPSTAVLRALRPIIPARLSLDVIQELPVEFQPIRNATVIPARRAWWDLFFAAANGGPRGGGVYNAYGRLFAWRSLAGLTGSSLSSNLDETARRVNEQTWLSFDTDWFAGGGADLGLIAVRPDGRTLAVLAATDPD